MHLLGYWEAKDWVFGQRQVRQPWQVLVVRVHVREREYERVGERFCECVRVRPHTRNVRQPRKVSRSETLSEIM